MTKSLSIVCALITTFIWGTAFIAQDTGMDNIGPLTFNAAPNLLQSFQEVRNQDGAPDIPSR